MELEEIRYFSSYRLMVRGGNFPDHRGGGREARPRSWHVVGPRPLVAAAARADCSSSCTRKEVIHSLQPSLLHCQLDGRPSSLDFERSRQLLPSPTSACYCRRTKMGSHRNNATSIVCRLLFDAKFQSNVSSYDSIPVVVVPSRASRACRACTRNGSEGCRYASNGT